MAERANGEGTMRKKNDGRWEARYYDPHEPDPKKQRKYIIGKNQKDVAKKLKAVLQEIDIWKEQIERGITVHALRHTYATNTLNSGIPAHTVAGLIGHKDGATTLKFYAHFIDSEAISQAEKMKNSI